MDETQMFQSYFKPNIYHGRCNSSVIDPVFVYQPNKVDNVEKKTSLIADHCLVKLTYHCKLLKTWFPPPLLVS